MYFINKNRSFNLFQKGDYGIDNITQFSKAKKESLFKKDLLFSKKTEALSFLKCYTFHPEKDMLFGGP